VQRHRERVGEHGDVVVDVVGNRGIAIESCAGGARRIRRCPSFALPVWIPGESPALRKFQQREKSPSWHGGRIGEMPRGHRRATVERDALPDLDARAAGPNLHDVADDLVPGAPAERDERVIAEVVSSLSRHETLLRSPEPQMPVIRFS